jgi:hypothetical protein
MTAAAPAAATTFRPGRGNAVQPNKETSFRIRQIAFADIDAHNSDSAAARDASSHCWTKAAPEQVVEATRQGG